jgi:hypothetical protein
MDFGRLEQLAKAWRQGFIYTGEYSPYRQRRHGSSSRDIAPHGSWSLPRTTTRWGTVSGASA